MDFGLSEEHRQLQERCRQLAADFATRSGEHDRDASHPTENYDRLRQEGFLELSVPREALGGAGVDFLGHTIAYEALGQGCPSTALSFNMHASVVMPLLDSPMVAREAKQHIADLVVRRKQLLAGNYSEATSTALLGERWLDTVVRRTDDGWRITGRKMFASMLQAADYCLVLARPDTATRPTAGAFVLIPRDAPGRSVIANWDVMGMRATRSNLLVLDDCQVEESAVVYQSDDIRTFRAQTSSWAWGSYTAVYLGVAGAIYSELLRVVGGRQVPGYSQTLAYHPDVRRQVAQLSAEASRRRVSSPTGRHGSTTRREGRLRRTAALFRAKYVVGEAVAHVARIALTLSGSHGIFKGGRIEQLFRDGALGPLHAPPSDFCLWNMGIHELGLDTAEVMPPLKPGGPAEGALPQGRR